MMSAALPEPRPNSDRIDWVGCALAKSYGHPGLTGKNRTLIRTWRPGKRPRQIEGLDRSC